MTLKEHKIESSKLKELNFVKRNDFYEHTMLNLTQIEQFIELNSSRSFSPGFAGSSWLIRMNHAS